MLGKTHTEIIPNASRSSLMPIIQGLIVKSKSNIYTDKWKSYDSLVFQGYKHTRINHSKEFARGHNHINGIESFWSYVKRKMRKHNGIPRKKFFLYLKEAEFRFNHRGKNLYKIIINLLGNY
jgi:transposase-like protein